MIITVAGCDGTGKTTICNNLSKRINCNITHFDKPKNLMDGKNQYFNFLKTIDKNDNIICDRFHDGEHVYAPLYRNYESDYLPELEVELRKHPFLLVYVKANKSIIEKRLLERGEDYIKLSDINKISRLYNKFLLKQSLPYIIIDTSTIDLKDNVDLIADNVNIIQNLFNYNKGNDIYFGNILSKKMVVLNDTSFKRKFRSNYKDYWFTTKRNEEFFNYQLKTLRPKEILEGRI